MLTPPPTETSCCPAERFTYSAVSFLTTPFATNRCGYKITVLKLSRYRSVFTSMRILKTYLKSEARLARSAAKGYPTELPRMKLQSHTEVWTGWSAGRCCGSRPLLTSLIRMKPGSICGWDLEPKKSYTSLFLANKIKSTAPQHTVPTSGG